MHQVLLLKDSLQTIPAVLQRRQGQVESFSRGGALGLGLCLHWRAGQRKRVRASLKLSAPQPFTFRHHHQLPATTLPGAAPTSPLTLLPFDSLQPALLAQPD